MIYQSAQFYTLLSSCCFIVLQVYYITFGIYLISWMQQAHCLSIFPWGASLDYLEPILQMYFETNSKVIRLSQMWYASLLLKSTSVSLKSGEMLHKHPKVIFIQRGPRLCHMLVEYNRKYLVSPHARARWAPWLNIKQDTLSHLKALPTSATSLPSLAFRWDCTEMEGGKKCLLLAVGVRWIFFFCFVLMMFKSNDCSRGKSIVSLLVLFVDVLHEDLVFQSLQWSLM